MYLSDTTDIIIKPVRLFEKEFTFILDKEIKDIVKNINDKTLWIVTFNFQMLGKCSEDEGYLSLLSSADLFTCDGAPIAWIVTFLTRYKVPRITGIQIVEYIIKNTTKSFGIIGGRSHTAALSNMKVDFSRVLFIFNGDINHNSNKTISNFADSIKATKPEYVFVALGIEKQDIVCKYLKETGVKSIYIGVGGTFEILAGEQKRAPEWISIIGIEWFFRFIQEPRRLFKRYFIDYPRGIYFYLKNRL
ncbi:MAG: WecB/TagA/CpsF family glycosyltransferase [Candidatus Electrothrix sp. YB6]